MKKFFIVPLFVFFLISCEKEGELTQNIPQNINNSTAVLLKSGILNPTTGISGSGNVKIYNDNNQRKLIFENYTIENGPDLKVYLSTTNTPTSFVNLGNATGSGVYILPEAVNLESYKYVLIHCQQYNHLFAIALLN